MSDLHIQDFDPTVEQVGCITGVPNSAYHDYPAVSHTKLDDFITRPAHYKGKYIDRVLEKINTDALKLGNAIHCMILEGPDAFAEQYSLSPDKLEWRGAGAKLTSCHKLNELLDSPLPGPDLERLATHKKEEILQAFDALPGQILLDPEEFEVCEKAYNSVMENELARELLGAGVAEVVFRTEETIHGFQLQCKADWLNVAPGLSERACELLKKDGFDYTPGIPYAVDLKTIFDLMAWEKEFVYRGYYRAYPFYAKTMELAVGQNVVEEWFWLAVEKEYPHSTIIRPPSPEVWSVGLNDINAALEALGQCMATGDWRDEAAKTVRRQALPDYMLRDDREPRIGVK